MRYQLSNFGTGKHAINWDGDNDLGHDVGSGIYFAQLDIEGARDFQKLVYLK